ncbi:hypothetical protein CEK62_06605 [Alcanivorax sp. N3-2A]|nr:hypothetical protein CEK62_06605 [Alcanivorax sp. N3-2A]|tara:strand:+ start:12402 stop:13169 length:768 start_codon:yes stop_codon:yes gene_type:complete
MFVRLRQLCLVARDLEAVVDDLRDVFDLQVCHRDPEVAQFGLHNALLAVGSSFIEIVAPVKPGTTAERYLEKRGGDGGYMVIHDSDDLNAWSDHLGTLNVRVAAELTLGDYRGLQLHPGDTGGALMEINSTAGGGSLDGAYGPAGPDWRQFVRTTVAAGIAGAELQSQDPRRLARRWSEILARPLTELNDQFRVKLDHGELRFVLARDGRGEGLGGIDVKVRDAHGVYERARRRGLVSDHQDIVIGGVRFYPRPL